MANKNILTRDTGLVSRQFNYAKGMCSLNFSLRVDVKSQLKDFKELLAAALKDVQEELNKK